MKSRLLVLALMASVAVGCKKGEKGDRGDTGLRGPGDIRILSGMVTSDNFSVPVNINPDQIAQMTAYLTDGVAWSELPYYLPGPAVNAFNLYTPSGASGSMLFMNCQAAGATGWQIVLILET